MKQIRLIAILFAAALIATWAEPAPSTSPAAPMTAESPPSPATQQAKRVNIVFILADDLDSASIQYMPKLKSLIADQGVTFTNYFVSMSLCCPSRATTLRGQYAHSTKILGNDPPDGGFEKFHDLGEEKSTIAVWLQNIGYRTMLAGKYLNGYPQFGGMTYVPPGWNEWYVKVGGRADQEFDYSLNENGKRVAYGDKPKNYGTDVYVRKTADFIRRSAAAGKPFFVYLAPHAPHAPSTPAPRHEKLFLDRHAPRTPNFNETDVSDKPRYIRRRPPLTQQQITSIDHHYRMRLQSLQAVDEGIEVLVNMLKFTGQLDNTYIFFTSDNGYHMGNHRLLGGKTAPYDEEFRVTMIVRGPGVPVGKTIDHLTGNVDLAPTWAELAGAKAADFVDGRSLVPLMRENPPAPNHWRQAFLIENGRYQAPPARATVTPAPNTPTDLLEPPDQDDLLMAILPFLQRSTLGVPAFRGFRTRTQSYVEYITGEKELYDLKSDPYQLQNLASQAAPALMAQYSARLKALMACKASACRTIEETPFNPSK